MLNAGTCVGRLQTGEPVFIRGDARVGEELQGSLKRSLATLANDYRLELCHEFGHGARRFLALLRYDGLEPVGLNLDRLTVIGSR